MATLDFDISEVFEQNLYADKRIVINRGGTRSTKTYSLLQLDIDLSFRERRKNYVWIRQHLPSLKLSALRDFQEILFTYQLEKYFKPHAINQGGYYENLQTGTKIHFISSDNPQKVHGVKWDRIHLNEGNEIPFDVFRQLILRTPGKIIIDFNPSNEDIWINTEIEQKRNDYDLIKSTYRDNPFLEPEIIKEIELLKQSDPMYFHVYGDGEYGTMPAKIYNHVKPISLDEYNKIIPKDMFGGIDVGDNHPTAFMEFKYTHNEKVYGHLHYYKKHKDPDDLVRDMNRKGINKDMPIYIDPAWPFYRRVLQSHGYNVHKAKKEAGSVKDGIKICQSVPTFITTESEGYWKEYRKYSWKQNSSGKILDEPIKIDDDAMDAKRYAFRGAQCLRPYHGRGLLS